MTPKSRGEKSHSGIPGSRAACAYPGHFRGWPRPSSALKPRHSPDGVACRALINDCLFGVFGETLTYKCSCFRFSYAWRHCERAFCCSLAPSLLIVSIMGVASGFDGYQ